MKILMLLFSFFFWSVYSCVASKAINSFYDVRCDESVDSGLYFEPIKSIRGRYFLKWCTLANKTVNEWKLDLYYYSSLVEPEQCNGDFLISSFTDYHIHSTFEQPVQVNSNCTNVCYTTTMDAIFSSTCYHIYTKQSIQRQGGVNEELTSCNHYHYVRENDTLLTLQDVRNINAYAVYQNDENDVVLDWHHSFPVSQYEVYMNPNGTIDQPSNRSVNMNCSTMSETLVRCRAAAAPPGCYSALFQHTAPWISLHRLPHNNFHHDFCHTGSQPPLEHPVSHSQLWWALVGFGGALLLGVLALLVLGVVRAARAGRLRKNILRTWVDDIARRLERPRASPAPGRIVLLYARDCEHMERAAAHLAALLQQVTGCEVVDLWRPATVAQSAPAAATWLRALLQRADSRVLLLQSPATALYCARRAPHEGEPALEAPLLGGRAAWRKPHAADAQLLLALRLLADSAHHEPLPYKKYYVATVAGLQHDDVVPALTPQRRYALPDAAALLLRDLAPAAAAIADSPAAPRLLQQLEDALRDFRKYALDNPDYLFRELVLD